MTASVSSAAWVSRTDWPSSTNVSTYGGVLATRVEPPSAGRPAQVEAAALLGVLGRQRRQLPPSPRRPAVRQHLGEQLLRDRLVDDEQDRLQRAAEIGRCRAGFASPGTLRRQPLGNLADHGHRERGVADPSPSAKSAGVPPPAALSARTSVPGPSKATGPSSGATGHRGERHRFAISGPGLDVNDLGLDVNSHGLRVNGPGLDVKGHGLDVKGHGLDVNDPRLRVKDHGLDVEGPVNDPGLDVKGHGLDVKGHGSTSRARARRQRQRAQGQRQRAPCQRPRAPCQGPRAPRQRRRARWRLPPRCRR